MSSFSIITDTGCDMPAVMAEKLGVAAVPLKVIIGGKTIDSSLSRLSIGKDSFYDLIRNGIAVKTASPSIDDFIRYFKRELKQGKDVLYIGFSTGLSGSYNCGGRACGRISRKKNPYGRQLVRLNGTCNFSSQLCKKTA